MARIFRDGRSPSTRPVLVKIVAAEEAAAVVMAVAADEEDEEADTATDIEFDSLVTPGQKASANA
jgi:hypothetical protein